MSGLDGRFVPLDMAPVGGYVTDLNAWFGDFLVGLTLPLHESVDIYGVGGARHDPCGVPKNAIPRWTSGYTYGGGLRIYLKENIRSVR